MYVRAVRGRIGIATAAEVALYKKRKKNYKIRIIQNCSKTRPYIFTGGNWGS